MHCCKAEEFKWCRGLDVLQCPDGEEYCLFHAPAEHKKMSVEDFNAQVFRRVDIAISGAQQCRLSGTIFPGNISFSNYTNDNPLPAGLYFSNSVFSGEANFKKTSFGGDVYFQDVTFNGCVSFFETKFGGITYFDESRFLYDAQFSRAQFHGESFFVETSFEMDCYFRRATFVGNVSFDSTTFLDTTNFKGAQFKKDTFFTGVKFCSDTYFTNARFGEKTHFNSSSYIKKTEFKYSRFSGEARFYNNTWKSDLYFQSSVFEDKTFFLNCKINQANFRACVFEKNCLFECVSFKKTSFLDTELYPIQFILCTWPKIGDRHVLYDELQGEDYPKVEHLYRRLKQKFREEQNEPLVADWHYGEKEMARKQALKHLWGKKIEAIFLSIYWLSSGYGEKYKRAGFVLFLLFVVFIFALSVVGLNPASNAPEFVKGLSLTFAKTYGHPDLGAFKYLPIEAFKHILFMRDMFFTPQGWGGHMVIILAKILIPVQAALFAFALRNRFRR